MAESKQAPKATTEAPKTPKATGTECQQRGHHEYKWAKTLDGNPVTGTNNQRCVGTDCKAERYSNTLT